ncbi:isoprenoid synthase domain-containing protein [Cladorrhinum sp. PSN259]|nr:isoprenoid synthase domain-containing protein [Cladorrhinum sp. PSN259]
MNYTHSNIIPVSSYSTDGLCDGIPLRLHKRQILEDLGCIRVRAQEDWRAHVAPIGLVKGLLGPEYNLVSTMFPECKPERVEVLSYFNEFVGLHDDVVEEVQQSLGDAQNDEARNICLDAAASGRKLPLERKQKRDHTGRPKMIRSVAEIDPVHASVTLKLWAEWFDQGSGRKFHTRFGNLDEYLDYRVLDVGEKLTTGMAIFIMSLHIPEHEFSLLSELCRPAWVAMGLTNDIYSWDKEKKAADLAGETHLCNSIWVLMQQYGIGKDEAEEKCGEIVRENVAEFVETVKGIHDRKDISRDLAVFVETAQYMISGNVVWSQGVPRYNPQARYNDRQLEWMICGAPKVVKVKDVEERRVRPVFKSERMSSFVEVSV